MKKMCLILLMVLSSYVGFSLDMSTGSGFSYDHTWGSATLTAGENSVHIAAKGNFLDFKGFFDAQYLLVELGTMVSVGTTDVSMASRVSGVYSSTSEQLPLRALNIHIGLFGKYPFRFGIAKIYPIAGVEFDFNVYANLNGQNVRSSMTKEQKKDANSYYFSFGGGTDIFINKNIFIRPLFLFGVQMNKSTEYKKLKKLALSDVHISSNSFKISTGLSIGYTF